ncbi:hypothetical protein AJ80_03549 [Polytolypa hystricis UAMH7299]|uniref:Mediator complex subunit 15 KIX domain-containing protein n=1 Tax=Polytolypa hystricis (strain UAMH7299) TaxID=1447883 RepID=A0A2B7Y8K8_POLH7|nr:hypothetical protein AJ80_03549 [Polytolypa hystricis UAMH7299]
MNPATLVNHGVGAPPEDKSRTDGVQMLMKHVRSVLERQGPFTGWREAVTQSERSLKVIQVVSSLRLIQPKADIQGAVHAAMNFEEKSFREARDKAEYDRLFSEKLQRIKDEREQRVQAMQNGMMAPGGIPGAGQVPMQQMFQQQMQRQGMHGSPIPIQQHQPGMRMNVPPQQMQMQPQQFMPQQRPDVARSDDLNSLSPQEFEQVSRLADQMTRKATPADIEKIKVSLQNMAPEQRQSLARRGLEPVMYFFRMQALREIRKHKMAARMRAQNMVQDGGNAVMQDPTMNSQRQMQQPLVGLQNNPAMPMNGQQQGPNYIGNIDQIQGKQAEGVRSQEAGQLVVPATNPLMNQRQFGAQQGVLPNGQPVANPGNVNPAILAQQRHNIQNAHQENLQQFQAQQAHARAQAAANAKIGLSSQGNYQIPQSMPQQSPAMSMLNRPIGPGQAPQQQLVGQGSPQSRPLGMGQDQSAVPNSRPVIPPGLPPALQGQLMNLPPDQLQVVLQNFQRRSMANNQGMQRQNQGSVPGQPPLPEAAQQAQDRNAQLIGDPNARAPVTMAPQMSGMSGVHPQNQMLQNQQQISMQQQQLMRLQQQHRAGAMEMTEDQLREMDRVPFPPAVINANPSIAPALPKNVKAWGQLKQWASQNPHIVGDVNLQRLQTLQKFHYTQMVQARNAQRQANQHAGGPNMLPATSQPQPFNQQAFQGQGQPQQQLPPNHPMMRPITANDIQMARQRIGPQAQTLTDDAIRGLLEKNRQHKLMQARNKAAASQAFVAQSQHQGQAVQPSPQQTQPFIPATQPPVSHPAQMQPSPASVSKPPASGAKAAPTPTMKQATTLKRPNTDDAADTQNSNIKPQSNTVAIQKPAAQNIPKPINPISREQVAALSAQQRSQLEAHLRRQQIQARQPITKTAADEAWSHLPEPIKKIYAELIQSDTATVPVAMSGEERAKMAQQLRECTDMLGRMDTLIPWVSKLPGQEKQLRGLLQMRMLLMKQFKGPDWTLADQFTIASDYLSSTIAYLKKWFQAMISHVRPKSQQPQQQAAQPSMAPLNASNLQQLEQQEEALQRAKRAHAHVAPPAPTALQPPFQLGAPSPQGVPQAYGPTNLTPDKLYIPPPNKRRKPNQQANKTPTSTPSAVGPTPAPHGVHQSPPETRKPTPGVAPLSFKCTITDCQYHVKGFASQAALDNHVDEEHKVEPPIADALEFALESIATGLGIKREQAEDASKVGPVVDGQAQEGKPGAVPKPQSDVKAESMTSGRPTSMPGKSASPASNTAKTPQLLGSKGPGASTLKQSKSKNGKKEAVKDQASPEDAASAKNAWPESAMSFDAIRAAFGDLGDQMPTLGPDPVDEILLSEAFTKIRPDSTPQSTDTGANTQTPNDSDMSKDDDIDLVPTDDNWIPADWVNLPGELEGGLLMQEPWEEINWDSMDTSETSMDWNKIDPTDYTTWSK